MSNATIVMWNGTVRALPFGEQVEGQGSLDVL
jgi:hypothetical protein